MRKIARFAAVLAIVVGITFMFGCPPPVTEVEPPSGLTVSADNTGSRVVLTWQASPTEDIDGYIIYFKAVGAKADYTPIDTLEATETSYEVDPNGVSGYYHVTAYKGDTESDPTEDVSTVPHYTGSVTVYELNGSGPSGYGWDRNTGAGAAYPMSQATSASSVDFYITNFAAGVSATPYYITSPDVSQQCADSTIVPSADWRANGIKSISPEEANSTLPAAGTYVSYEELVGDSYYGVHTTDNYFAVVHTLGAYNPQDGTQNLESWFQLVQGLRLINH